MDLEWEGRWWFRHRNRAGYVKWEKFGLENAVVNEGEENVLKAYFTAESVPTEFYLGLANDSILETDGLGDIQGEPSGNGYSRALIERSTVGFPTIELHEGDYRITSKTVTFTASGGDLGPVNVAFLSTTSDNTGKLIAFAGLTLERTILDGDSLEGGLQIKLK